MAIKTFKRYEEKYLINKDQYKEMLPVLLAHMNFDKHCKNGENYGIYNIYFDTDKNEVISHSIDKPYYKEKLRLRSYKLPTSQEDIVFLELKKKINGIVNKRRATLTLIEAKKFLEQRENPVTKNYLTNQVLNEISYYLKNNDVKPKVFISYNRLAFFGKENSGFRITFDSEIITRRNDVTLEAGGLGETLLDSDKYLMEVKIIGAMPLWFTELLTKHCIFSTNFSKYGTEYKNYLTNSTNNYSWRLKRIC